MSRLSGRVERIEQRLGLNQPEPERPKYPRWLEWQMEQIGNWRPGCMEIRGGVCVDYVISGPLHGCPEYPPAWFWQLVPDFPARFASEEECRHWIGVRDEIVRQVKAWFDADPELAA